MAHVAISSDLSGSIFAVDHLGDLCLNQHARADGTGPLVHPGLGKHVGSGWNGVQHLAVVKLGDRLLFAAVGPSGEFLTSSAGANPSSVVPPRVGGVAPPPVGQGG